jgi:hypothetical protein
MKTYIIEVIETKIYTVRVKAECIVDAIDTVSEFHQDGNIEDLDVEDLIVHNVEYEYRNTEE